MRIQNVHLSTQLAPFFHERFKEKYSLYRVGSHNDDDPLILYGCYDYASFGRAFLNKNTTVICWQGGDAMKIERNKNLNRPNVFHISQSPWITKDLIKSGLTPIELPVCCVDIDKWKPQPLGDKIYLYTSHARANKYGEEHYLKLIDYFGEDKFIVAEFDSFKNITEVYRQCRFGLRLTPHDGLSETAAELGLMGRMVIHNGDLPNMVKH